MSCATFDSPSSLASRTHPRSDSVATYLDTKPLEALYRELGALEGRYAGPAGREALRRDFAAEGDEALRWLVERLRSEQSEDTLRGATLVLVSVAGDDLWRFMATEVLKALRASHGDRRPSTSALLQVLAELPVPSGAERGADELVRLAQRSRDGAVRELGLVLAARLVQREELYALFAADPDAEVRETLAELRRTQHVG